MKRITLDIAAEQRSGQLVHRGISPTVRVPVVPEVPDATDVPEDDFDLPGTGSLVPSVVRFTKLAMLKKSLPLGRIGDAPPDWLGAQKATFFGVVGFDP